MGKTSRKQSTRRPQSAKAPGPAFARAAAGTRSLQQLVKSLTRQRTGTNNGNQNQNNNKNWSVEDFLNLNLLNLEKLDSIHNFSEKKGAKFDKWFGNVAFWLNPLLEKKVPIHQFEKAASLILSGASKIVIKTSGTSYNKSSFKKKTEENMKLLSNPFLNTSNKSNKDKYGMTVSQAFSYINSLYPENSFTVDALRYSPLNGLPQKNKAISNKITGIIANSRKTRKDISHFNTPATYFDPSVLSVHEAPLVFISGYIRQHSLINQNTKLPSFQT
jgi:hypothetical protein